MKMFLLRMMATGCFTIANGRSGELITICTNIGR
jgi:hypothetical protein